MQSLLAADPTPPLSLLEGLGPTQWTACFEWLLEAAFLLFHSLSRVETQDVKGVAVLAEGQNAEQEGKRRILKAFRCVRLLLKRVPADKKTNLELETLNSWLTRVLAISTQSILSLTSWNSLKDLVLSNFCGILRRLVKDLGDMLHSPFFFRIVKHTIEGFTSHNEVASGLLALCLYRIGCLFADTALDYMTRTRVGEAVLEGVRSAGTNDTLLGTAKKMRSRKIGNSHQKRSQKNAMKRDESKKLQAVEQQLVSAPAQTLSTSALYCHSSCKVLDSAACLPGDSRQGGLGWVAGGGLVQVTSRHANCVVGHSACICAAHRARKAFRACAGANH